MRRSALIALLTALALLLGGCSELDQVENLAFVILMGVDRTESGGIEVSVQVPKISGGRGGSEEGGSPSGDLVFAASGETFAEAMTALRWIVPRRLDVSQIELIVVSEALASEERWLDVMNDMMQTNRLYTAARLAVCEGSAQAFIRAEKPLIGTRTADELTAMFEEYVADGFVPDTSFADIYYKSVSAYSDPVAVYAAPAPEAGGQAQGGAGEAEDAPAAAIVPDDVRTDEVQTEQETRFLGAAVFRDGRMVGTLDGRTLLYCKLLRGKSQSFAFDFGGRTVQLATLGRALGPRGCVRPAGADPRGRSPLGAAEQRRLRDRRPRAGAGGSARRRGGRLQGDRRGAVSIRRGRRAPLRHARRLDRLWLAGSLSGKRSRNPRGLEGGKPLTFLPQKNRPSGANRAVDFFARM